MLDGANRASWVELLADSASNVQLTVSASARELALVTQKPLVPLFDCPVRVLSGPLHPMLQILQGHKRLPASDAAMEPNSHETTSHSHWVQMDATRPCYIAGDVNSSQPLVGFGHTAGAPSILASVLGVGLVSSDMQDCRCPSDASYDAGSYTLTMQNQELSKELG